MSNLTCYGHLSHNGNLNRTISDLQLPFKPLHGKNIKKNTSYRERSSFEYKIYPSKLLRFREPFFYFQKPPKTIDAEDLKSIFETRDFVAV